MIIFDDKYVFNVSIRVTPQNRDRIRSLMKGLVYIHTIDKFAVEIAIAESEYVESLEKNQIQL